MSRLMVLALYKRNILSFFPIHNSLAYDLHGIEMSPLGGVKENIFEPLAVFFLSNVFSLYQSVHFSNFKDLLISRFTQSSNFNSSFPCCLSLLLLYVHQFLSRDLPKSYPAGHLVVPVTFPTQLCWQWCTVCCCYVNASVFTPYDMPVKYSLSGFNVPAFLQIVVLYFLPVIHPTSSICGVHVSPKCGHEASVFWQRKRVGRELVYFPQERYQPIGVHLCKELNTHALTKGMYSNTSGFSYIDVAVYVHLPVRIYAGSTYFSTPSRCLRCVVLLSAVVLCRWNHSHLVMWQQRHNMRPWLQRVVLLTLMKTLGGSRKLRWTIARFI